MSLRSAILLSLVLLAAGCGKKEPVVRTYVDRTVSVPHTAMPPMAGGGGGPMAPGSGPAAPSLPPIDLKYDLPAGWDAKPGSGFRLVTFTVPADGQSLECLVSQLGPEASEPVSNITRWIGQIGQDSPDAAAVAEFCGKLPPLETLGGWRGSLVDLKPFAKDTSMLAAILPLPDRTLFVKMTGPTPALDAQRASFESLCKSLRSAP